MGTGGAFSAKQSFASGERLRGRMRQVEVRLRGWMVADAVAELRIWLDHNNCVPLSFDIHRLPPGGICVRVEFSDEAVADAFQREFAR